MKKTITVGEGLAYFTFGFSLFGLYCLGVIVCALTEFMNPYIGGLLLAMAWVLTTVYLVAKGDVVGHDES
jgi:hypothetical protein